MKILPFSKTYDGRTVLTFPGLTLQPGKTYGVIGANGSGKSTFARILAGVLPPDQKASIFDAALSVGHMPQKNYAFRLSVRANLLLNSRNEEKAAHLMEALRLSHLADKRADRLSGGETARMALARLMMGSYDLVILDEPTAAMDMETTLLAEQLITDYVKENSCTLILVTHSLQQARRIADEVLFFQKGQLTEYGKQEILLRTPSTGELKEFLDFYGL